jgi:hypothetical protein
MAAKGRTHRREESAGSTGRYTGKSPFQKNDASSGGFDSVPGAPLAFTPKLFFVRALLWMTDKLQGDQGEC